MKNHPKNINADIPNLDATVCKMLIENLNKSTYSGMTLYCTGSKNLVTPIKETTEEDKAPAASGVNVNEEKEPTKKNNNVQTKESQPAKSVIPV